MKRNVRTKLDCTNQFRPTDIQKMEAEIADRDKAYKKNWENQNRHPKSMQHEFKINDKVLFKNREMNKWSTPYEKEHYIVTEVLGSSIKAQRKSDGRIIYRDASKFKLLHEPNDDRWRQQLLSTPDRRYLQLEVCDTISKWLADEASTPVEFPKGLVRTVFDNEQVIGKTYRIKADSKVPTSIVTSHLYICIDPESTIQNDEKFAPSNWLFDKPNDHQKALFLSEDENCVNVFRVTRNNLISRCLVSVELEHSNGSFDFIDSVLSRKACREKVCLHCGAENEFTGRKCTNCKGPLVHECQNFSDIYDKKNNLNPYSFFSSIETETHNFSVKTGEPDLCNPGSFENVAEILTNVSERAGITNDRESGRKWLFLECDGGIYSIVDKLIFNVYHCTQCDEGFYGYDNFLEHRCSILHNIQPQHQYGWLVPLPGLLHIEMNACKAFFEITWDVVLKDFCMKLGYNSPKALDYAKSCGDHHKSWKILEIFYLAAADELLVPYVRECKISNIEPSVEGYWLWASDIEDPNYMFIQQMVFTYLHSMILFRVGCRRGNAVAIVAGREKMSHLFFARNHPRYQRIISQSRYIEVMMPDELKDIVKSSLTLSRTGNTGHYQGGDACLEEINKEAKCWISPKGIPSDKEWLRVFRNLDNLMTVCYF
ncbi:uncharacterized protein LOC132755133 [Ruditapes philippinarum]|uniref:uncharacterized protein LOC132755133 n=1 Tax=Ruditapes philippinarum TaxID=129788 RepID=UPI00295AC092|nr:uncharacterized protein LOC132755133 [Ruditapes philippinarum]